MCIYMYTYVHTHIYTYTHRLGKQIVRDGSPALRYGHYGTLTEPQQPRGPVAVQKGRHRTARSRLATSARNPVVLPGADDTLSKLLTASQQADLTPLVWRGLASPKQGSAPQLERKSMDPCTQSSAASGRQNLPHRRFQHAVPNPLTWVVARGRCVCLGVGEDLTPVVT